jgi:hypothetical protein
MCSYRCPRAYEGTVQADARDSGEGVVVGQGLKRTEDDRQALVSGGKLGKRCYVLVSTAGTTLPVPRGEMGSAVCFAEPLKQQGLPYQAPVLAGARCWSRASEVSRLAKLGQWGELVVVRLPESPLPQCGRVARVVGMEASGCVEDTKRQPRALRCRSPSPHAFWHLTATLCCCTCPSACLRRSNDTCSFLVYSVPVSPSSTAVVLPSVVYPDRSPRRLSSFGAACIKQSNSRASNHKAQVGYRCTAAKTNHRSGSVSCFGAEQRVAAGRFERSPDVSDLPLPGRLFCITPQWPPGLLPSPALPSLSLHPPS